MKEFTLAVSIQDLPKNFPCALWQGREAPQGVVCLENMLDAHLAQIRKLHMQWAYEVGAASGFQDILKCGDTPSMWWTSQIYERHPKVSPELYTIYKLACVEIWLAEGEATALRVMGGDPRLVNCLRQLCASRKLGFTAEQGSASAPTKKWLRNRIYESTPAPLRALVRFGAWFWKTRRILPLKDKLPQLPVATGATKPAATIATYFPNIDMQAAADGRFRSRYWEDLHEALNQEAARERPGGPHFVHWLFLYFHTPGINLADAVKLRSSFEQNGSDGLSFNFLEEFLTAADVRLALKRFAKIAIKSFRLEHKFAQECVTRESSLNFWPYLRWQWAESFRGWRCLERCLFNIAFRRYCEMAGRQRWTLFALENCPWERMLTVAVRQVPGNGPVFGAQHSTLRPTDFRYFDDPRTFTYPDCAAFQPDIIAGNGAAACGQWRQNSMPESRLAQVEALRYLYLAKTRTAGKPSALPPDEGKPVEPPAPRRMLVVTSFFRDETQAHLALVKECMRTGILDEWQITLKAHPYLHPGEWLESLEKEQRTRIYVSAQPLALELTPGTTVWASNSTTAALEAAMSRLPVMVMAASNDFDLCPIQDAPGLLRTATTADVEHALRNLAPLELEPGYLDLDTRLPRWRALLGLTGD